jgi:ATP-dependent Lon protease
MKNAHKLRKADDTFRMMSIKHDMTQEERDQDKKLRAEAKDKQEIDKSGNFLYLVRGMPWERHMQKIKIRKAEQDLDQEGSVGPQETGSAYKRRTV